MNNFSSGKMKNLALTTYKMLWWQEEYVREKEWEIVGIPLPPGIPPDEVVVDDKILDELDKLILELEEILNPQERGGTSEETPLVSSNAPHRSCTIM
jgi:ElaB/YqjD/DUF883 family membrane-anchored ribosome-binding protein